MVIFLSRQLDPKAAKILARLVLIRTDFCPFILIPCQKRIWVASIQTQKLKAHLDFSKFFLSLIFKISFKLFNLFRMTVFLKICFLFNSRMKLVTLVRLILFDRMMRNIKKLWQKANQILTHQILEDLFYLKFFSRRDYHIYCRSKRPHDQFLTPTKLIVDFTMEKSTRKSPNIHFFRPKNHWTNLIVKTSYCKLSTQDWYGLDHWPAEMG